MPESCNDWVLEELLFARPASGVPGARAPIDFAALDRQMDYFGARRLELPAQTVVLLLGFAELRLVQEAKILPL